MAASMFMLSADAGDMESSDSEVEIPTKDIIGGKRNLGNKREKERLFQNAHKAGRRKEKRKIQMSKKVNYLCIDQLYDSNGYAHRLM
jgi:hypothetical protein